MNTFKKPVLLILGMLLLIFILWSFTKTMKEPDDTDAVKTEAETIQNIDKKRKACERRISAFISGGRS